MPMQACRCNRMSFLCAATHFLVQLSATVRASTTACDAENSDLGSSLKAFLNPATFPCALIFGECPTHTVLDSLSVIFNHLLLVCLLLFFAFSLLFFLRHSFFARILRFLCIFLVLLHPFFRNFSAVLLIPIQ